MEKIKVLVLGATGMLGHQVVSLFLNNSNYEVVDVSFRKKIREQTIILDLTDKEKLKTLIQKIKPAYVINCVGVLIGGSNKSNTNAIYINSYLPHLLADLCNDINSKLIHVSTDCVFSGEKGRYTEMDFKDGKDVYSKSKSLGEVINTQHLTLRTSIIGPELKQNGEGLFQWFTKQNGEISGYTKAIWSGVTTLELAKVIKSAIEQNLVGLYHVTNGEGINKYDLLELFKLHTGKNITINAIDGKAVNKSLIDTRKELDHEMPSYNQMIKEMVENINLNKELYTFS